LRPEVWNLGGEPEEGYTRTKSQSWICLQEIKMANQTRTVVHLTALIGIKVVQLQLKVITEFFI